MRNLTLSVILFIVCTFFTPLNAQKEGNVWIFGSGIGLDFNHAKPKVIESNKINTYEGCSSISDKYGHLMLYTDGITIWNKEHKIMENGQGLHGHPSSTQSGIIVSKPMSSSIYYVFTVDASENFLAKGLEYAEIDISANKGLGKVVKKHQSLLPLAEEKVTGIVHENGKDIWIVTHKWNTDEFYAFLVSENGVSTTPIVSKSGSIHKGGWKNSIGYLKASPKGNKLALALHDDSIFEIFDFDNATGKVSNGFQTESFKGLPYGIEFSPNGRFLYVSTMFGGTIVQYDLKRKPSSVLKRKKVIRKDDDRSIGSMQLAPNGRIYYQIFNTDRIGVIKRPNKLGKEVKLSDKGLKIPKFKGRFGLPTFVQTYFSQENIRKLRRMRSEPVEEVEKPITKLIEKSKPTSSSEPVSKVEKPTIQDDFKITVIVKETVSDEREAVLVKEGMITDLTTKQTFENKNAQWSFSSEADKYYQFQFKKDGYFINTLNIPMEEVKTAKSKGAKEMTKVFWVKRIEKNKEIILEDVYFNYDKWDIRADSKLILDRLVALLKENPKLLIHLSAHTDCRGSDTYNLKLSDRRANSVMDYLILKGINTTRLTAKGYGKNQPRIICPCGNCSEAEHQSNRRLTFKVVGEQ